MSFTGWALTLNGVTVTFDCDHSNVDEFCSTFDNTVLDGALEAPPDGLDVPDKRTEDITFAQRDGVKHYNDWYDARVVTAIGQLGPEDDCGSCTTVRQQRAELLKAWRRSCCDIELVIHTPCDGDFDDGGLILGDQTYRYNLAHDPSVAGDPYHWYFAGVSSGVARSFPTDGGFQGDTYFRLTVGTGGNLTGVTYNKDEATFSEEIEVTEGLDYVMALYMRTSKVGGISVTPIIRWYNEARDTVVGTSTGTAQTVAAGTGWTRVTMTATAPTDAAYTGRLNWTFTNPGDGETVDADALLFEQASTVGSYFDGDTVDEDDQTDGGAKTFNVWTGRENASISGQSSQTYEVFQDRSLYGPVGIIGRPRVAKAPWAARKEQIADFTLRFDATDHLMYVLDECGTPGYQQCRTIRPGNAVTCRTYPRCYGDSGRCYSNQSITSVLPVSVPVGGTEQLNPLFVLYPNLSYPTITNMDTGETLTFNGVVLTEPIVIETKDGIAYGQTTGTSYTHLLSGVIFLSIVPGTQEFSLFSRGPQDSGSASICWRDAVVSI